VRDCVRSQPLPLGGEALTSRSLSYGDVPKEGVTRSIRARDVMFCVDRRHISRV
jgi:hypothetical protein